MTHSAMSNVTRDPSRAQSAKTVGLASVRIAHICDGAYIQFVLYPTLSREEWNLLVPYDLPTLEPIVHMMCGEDVAVESKEEALKELQGCKGQYFNAVGIGRDMPFLRPWKKREEVTPPTPDSLNHDRASITKFYQNK